jgi:hypothetical protein
VTQFSFLMMLQRYMQPEKNWDRMNPPFNPNCDLPISSSQNLDKYFSVLQNHLNPTEVSRSVAKDFPTHISSSAPSGSLKKMLITSDGMRLPTVAKRALPLPPEDCRLIPCLRSQGRVPSPPVVTVGRVDIAGVPLPWSMNAGQNVGAYAVDNTTTRLPPSEMTIDYLRRAVRSEFESIEGFIEQAFSSYVDAN